MAAPSVPANVIVQQGNGQVYISWDAPAGATSYTVQRSTDNSTYSTVSSPTVPHYLDSTVTVGTQYWYKVSATGSGGTSSYSIAQSIVPTRAGQMTLGQVRLAAQQRADRVGSQFVTTAEWNSYINQSYFELYDLLTTVFEDYYLAAPYIFATNGSDSSYQLPNGVLVGTDAVVTKPFYKLRGVDMGLTPNMTNAWTTLSKYDFIERNRYVFPNLTSTYMGVFNMRYRVMGDKLMFIPTPSANQYIRVWYQPRVDTLLQDSDILDGISGWTEYVIVDAAIKALQKEESDVSVLMAQKQMLKQRIEETAMNRDIGEPDTISSTRSWGSRNGNWGGPGWDGGFGGY